MYATVQSILRLGPDADLSPLRKPPSQNMLIRELFLQKGDAAKLRVENICKKFNRKIREALSDATGFQLSGDVVRKQISYEVVDYVPDEFLAVLSRLEHPVVFELLMTAGSIANYKSLVSYLAKNLELLRDKSLLPRQIEAGYFSDSERIISHLLNGLDKLKINAELKSIPKDTLGAYFPYRGEIHIYWIPIVIEARLFGFSVEEQTLITLIHEMAHAYTHIGLDKDEKNWDNDAFCEADLHLVEGLAQFYTHLVTDRVSPETSLHDAFLRDTAAFLPTSPYRAHEPWLPESSDAHETMRFALIEARRRHLKSYEMFTDVFLKLQARLGTTARQTAHNSM